MFPITALLYGYSLLSLQYHKILTNRPELSFVLILILKMIMQLLRLNEFLSCYDQGNVYELQFHTFLFKFLTCQMKIF